PQVQDRGLVGATRRAASRLCHGRHTARRVPSERVRRPMELESQSRPRLPKGVKLKHDEVRARWTLLAPERIFEIDATAAAVLELCDGERDLGTIVAELAQRYTAPPAVIEKDVVAMLADLKMKRVLET